MKAKSERDIIRTPILTEQSMRIRGNENTYTFTVAADANKIEIRNAVKKLFEVDVLSVRTANFKGKVKRHGLKFGRRPSWKKAFVKIKPEQQIKEFDGIS
ncbi:MAG: 50S ribosomal protein L23 [Fibrobacterota bacterium]